MAPGGPGPYVQHSYGNPGMGVPYDPFSYPSTTSNFIEPYVPYWQHPTPGQSNHGNPTQGNAGMPVVPAEPHNFGMGVPYDPFSSSDPRMHLHPPEADRLSSLSDPFSNQYHHVQGNPTQGNTGHGRMPAVPDRPYIEHSYGNPGMEIWPSHPHMGVPPAHPHMGVPPSHPRMGVPPSHPPLSSSDTSSHTGTGIPIPVPKKTKKTPYQLAEEKGEVYFTLH